MKILGFLPFLITTLICKGDTLEFNVSVWRDQEIKLWVYYGAVTDTIGVIKLDSLGYGCFELPSRAKSRFSQYVVGYNCNNSHQSSIIVTAGESIFIESINGYKRDFEVENSSSNKTIKNFNDQWSILKQKRRYLNSLRGFYQQDNHFYTPLINEIRNLENDNAKFYAELIESNSYESKFFRLVLASEQIKDYRLNKTSSSTNTIRNHFISSVDFDVLYTSGLWFSLINNCLPAYYAYSSFHEKFGEDIIANLFTIEDKEPFEALAKDALYICSKAGWLKDKERIEDFLILSGRVSGEWRNELTKIQKVHIGKKAPDLLFGKSGIKTFNHPLDSIHCSYVLLFFNETSCNHCQNEIDNINSSLDSLKKNDIRLISLSADTDIQSYHQGSKEFMWNEHYCSGLGYEDENFLNYFITGTPTYYLLDSNGIIVAKSYTINSILTQIEKLSNLK